VDNTNGPRIRIVCAVEHAQECRHDCHGQRTAAPTRRPHPSPFSLRRCRDRLASPAGHEEQQGPRRSSGHAPVHRQPRRRPDRRLGSRAREQPRHSSILTRLRPHGRLFRQCR
jgi:hypothetical protein